MEEKGKLFSLLSSLEISSALCFLFVWECILPTAVDYYMPGTVLGPGWGGSRRSVT